MRYVSTTIVAAIAVLTPSAMVGAGLSITNYQLVSTQVINANLSSETFHATLMNQGPALASVVATVSTANPFAVRVVPGEDTLNYAPVPANSQVASSDTFTILVNPSAPIDFTNLQWTFQSTAAPVIANAGPNQTVNVGTLVTLNGSASTNPSGIGMLSYSWTFTSLPPGSGAVLSNTTAVMPTFVVDVAGTYVIKLTVSNGVASSSASVTITTGNSPPVANAGPNQTVLVGSTVTLNGSGSFDVNGNPLTYSWVLLSKPAGSAATLTGANTVSPTFVADLPTVSVGPPGTAGNMAYIVQLIVNDGITNSSPSTVTITTGTSGPVANAGPNQVVNVGTLVQLDGSGSTDANGNPLTYHWGLLSVPTGSSATLSNPNIVNPTFTADLSGIYVIQLLVNDGTQNSNLATVTISTNAILAPTANAGRNQTVQLHTVVELQGSGTDPQGLPLTFQWALISIPSGSNAVLSSTTSTSPSFSVDVPGTYIAQLIVSNGFLNSSPSTATITTNGITAPVASAGPNQTVVVGATVTLNGGGSSDSNGNPLTYSWSLLTIPVGSAATLTGANTVTPTFVADVAGAYVAQLIVNDGVSNSAPATVMITTQTLTLTPNPLNVATNPGVLTVTLSAPAGAGGQVVNLAIVDTSIATTPASVTVPPGSLSAPITITPVAVGTTSILATSSGFSNALATINVTSIAQQPQFTIGFSPTSLTITGSATQNLTLNLSPAAPAGGLTINVISINPAVATVPASVTFTVGATSASVPVTGVAAGSATIAASAPNIATTFANVSVVQFTIGFSPTSLSITGTATQNLTLNLSPAAPAGGLTINVTSSNPAAATAPASVTFTVGTTSVSVPVTGVAAGSATITASALPNIAATTASVSVTAPSDFVLPSNPTVEVGNTVSFPFSLAQPAGPDGVFVTLSSSDTTTLTVSPTTLFISAGATTPRAPPRITGIAAGSATITVSAFGLTSASVLVPVTP